MNACLFPLILRRWPVNPVLTYLGTLRSVCPSAPCLSGKILRIITVSMRLFFFNIKTHSTKTLLLLRKEVIQPHLPIRLPCYDFTPVIGFALGSIFPADFGHPQLPWCDGRCVQDPGTHSPRHSDPRLLATPTSCRRVSACSPNWDCL